MGGLIARIREFVLYTVLRRERTWGTCKYVYPRDWLYVNWESGDDSNDGLTPETAFKTIGRACDESAVRRAVGVAVTDGKIPWVFSEE